MVGGQPHRYQHYDRQDKEEAESRHHQGRGHHFEIFLTQQSSRVSEDFALQYLGKTLVEEISRRSQHFESSETKIVNC